MVAINRNNDCGLFINEVLVLMDWFAITWIFGGIGVFVWIIVAARFECDRMNSRK